MNKNYENYKKGIHKITNNITIKHILADIVVFFIMCFVFNDVYKELRKNCYDLQKAHRRMWGLIFIGLFMWACIFILAYVRGWLQ